MGQSRSDCNTVGGQAGRLSREWAQRFDFWAFCLAEKPGGESGVDSLVVGLRAGKIVSCMAGLSPHTELIDCLAEALVVPVVRENPLQGSPWPATRLYLPRKYCFL
jgi:hypothetical protein